MEYAIVVPAFQRPASLKRLLHSLQVAAKSVKETPQLIISIDQGDGTKSLATRMCAEEFAWEANKRIIVRSSHFGLKSHILACGDLTDEVGTVVLLEEDVCVSPTLFDYIKSALRHYAGHPKIAGISLYSIIYNEFSSIPFTPIDDGFDTYFAQTGSSWGQIWTRSQWSDFRSWMSTRNEIDQVAIPDEVVRWPASSSWKREFNYFLSERKKYVVFPRFSLSTNMGDSGVHLPSPKTHLTASLSVRRAKFTFGNLDDALAKYDSFLEIESDSLKALVPKLRAYDFDVDLTGAKDMRYFTKSHVLTCRKSLDTPILTVGLKHYPPELNVIFDEPGEDIGLYKRVSIHPEIPAGVLSRMRGFFVPSFDSRKNEA